VSQFLSNPRAQTLAGRPRRRITFGAYDRTAGYPVVADLSGTPAAVAELERALVALPRLAEALRDALKVMAGLVDGLEPDDLMLDFNADAFARARAALALLDGADAPPVAAHAAVDGADDSFQF
jgi:hypothetical protein